MNGANDNVISDLGKMSIDLSAVQVQVKELLNGFFGHCNESCIVKFMGFGWIFFVIHNHLD